MSLRYFSSCFIRAFVAIGRGDIEEDDPEDDLDDFLDLFGKLSRESFGGSENLTVGLVGPLFGVLLLLY